MALARMAALVLALVLLAQKVMKRNAKKRIALSFVAVVAGNKSLLRTV